MHVNHLVSYSYKKSIPGALVQGIKENKTPKNAVSGGNGSFRLYPTPPSVPAIVKDRFDCAINVDLYYAIKKGLEKANMRVTEKRVKIICDYLIKDHLPFEMDLDDYHRWVFKDVDVVKIVKKGELT